MRSEVSDRMQYELNKTVFEQGYAEVSSTVSFTYRTTGRSVCESHDHFFISCAETSGIVYGSDSTRSVRSWIPISEFCSPSEQESRQSLFLCNQQVEVFQFYIARVDFAPQYEASITAIQV